MTAALHEAAESARRIAALVKAGWPIWNQFDRDAVTLARFVSAMPEVQAARWRPVLAGGKP